MGESPIFGIENACGETGVTVRNSYLATASEQPGYQASNVLDESIGTSWRSASTDPVDTRLLVRFPQLRRLLTVAALGHNLGRHALWRLTGDDEYAIRPAVSFDGVDDSGLTPLAIPSTADATVCLRFWMRPQPVTGNTVSDVVFHLWNGANYRLRLQVMAGSFQFGYAFVLRLLVYNWAATIQAKVEGLTGPVADGRPHDVVVRYRDSDRLCELIVDGASLGTATAATGWSATGPEQLSVAAGGGTFARITVQDLVYWGRYLEDSEISSYRAKVLAGTEPELNGSWHFLEGVGSTVSDTTGTADLAIGAGTWVEMVNPFPRFSTGIREAWCQWQRRQVLNIGPGVSVQSPSLGAAPRDLTVAFLLRVPRAVDSSAIGRFGPSLADAEMDFAIVDGKLQLRSNRGASAQTATSAMAVNDGIVRRVRGVIDGRANTLSLYLASDGEPSEALQESSALGDYDAVPNCVLAISTDATAEAVTADWRVYAAVRLESDDDLTRDAAPADPERIAQVRCDGSIVDLVDPSRVYSVTGASYSELEQAATRTLPAADERRVDADADPFERYPRRLIAYAAPVEVREAFLEIWDLENTDGYVALHTLALQDGQQVQRAKYASRRFQVLPATRSQDGIVSLERGYLSDQVRIEVQHDLDAWRGDGSPGSDELLARLLRRDADLLVTVILYPGVPEHRLVDHSVVGYLEQGAELAEIDEITEGTTLEIRGVYPPRSPV